MGQQFADNEMSCPECSTRFEILTEGLQAGEFKCPECKRDLSLIDFLDFRIQLAKTRLRANHIRGRFILGSILCLVCILIGRIWMVAQDIPIVSWTVLMVGILIFLISLLALYLLMALPLPIFNRENSTTLMRLQTERDSLERRRARTAK